MRSSKGDVAKTWGLAVALLLGCSSARLIAQPVAFDQDQPGGPKYMPGEVLVKFRADVTDEQIGAAFRGARLGLVKHILTDAMRHVGDFGVTRAQTTLPVRQALDLLKQLPGVEYAEPNWVYEHCAATFDDPFYLGGSGYDLWGMYGPNTTPANSYGSAAAEAWAAGFTGDPNVCVGIIDEGIDFSHPDLAANVWLNPGDSSVDGNDQDGNLYTDDIHGWNFFGDNNQIYSPADGDRHGTHVAGTIAAGGGNGIGVDGVAWKVKFIAGKFLGPYGGSLDDAISAIDYFTDLKQNRRINVVALNNSWGGGGFSQALLDAIVRAAKQDILFVAAAGNGNSMGLGVNNDRTPFYPACYNTTSAAGYDSVIAVTAIARDGSLGVWANYGAKTVDLGAPGLDVWSTQPGNSYDSFSGTSMATPHVTGAIALYAATHPGVTAVAIRDALMTSAKRFATASLTGKTVTGGRLNVKDFINTPTALAPPVSTPAAPTGLNETFAGTTVTLNWTDNSTDETGFLVTRTESGSGATMSCIVAADRTSYSETSVAGNTTYTYTVAAMNAAGLSAPLSVTLTTGGTTGARATPLGLDTTTGGSWVGSYGSQGYSLVGDAIVYPSYATVLSANELIHVWTNTTSDLRALQKAANPNDRVAACWYSSMSFLLDINIADSVAHRVTLYAVDWDAYTRAEAFEVSDAASGAVLSTLQISSFHDGQYVSWNILGHVKIRVITTGSPNAVVSGVFFDDAGAVPPAPTAPTISTVKADSSSQITVNWVDNSSNEVGFRIERASGNAEFSALTVVPAGTATYVDVGLSANTSYSYRVIAFNGGGGAASDSISATTLAALPAPLAPTNLRVSAAPSATMKLSWADNANNEDGYKIERSSAGSAFVEIARAGKDAISFVDSGLSFKTTYTYRVRAFNTGGDSAYSNTASATAKR